MSIESKRDEIISPIVSRHLAMLERRGLIPEQYGCSYILQAQLAAGKIINALMVKAACEKSKG